MFTLEMFTTQVLIQTGKTLPKSVLKRMYQAKYPPKKERAPKKKSTRLWAKCDYQKDGVRYKIETHTNGNKVHSIVDYRTDYKSTITSSFEGERNAPSSFTRNNTGLTLEECKLNQYI